ncbi:hypothetical protein GDO86_007175 [Hymenochirus boettgeri]|uniref:Coiled-coil domain containing 71 n=1 Tax=Hymenochirus boettgeri TaxID=247094 RepID=A0A8T2IZY4_9PIPI|nr:hypothetical protein GDO86_007175 [Hymenochirus boettgeri]
MNLEVAHMEEKAVHSWSRISSAGKRALEEALRVFNPMSKDLTDTETQLVTFLQGLREEGFQPTILSSKDVYGYNSTTADAPTPGSKCPTKNTSVHSKAQSKSTASKLSSASVAISVHSAKVTNKDSPKGSTNLFVRPLNQTKTGKSNLPKIDLKSSTYPDVYPAMRLSVVLEALVPLQKAAPTLDSKLRRRSVVVASTRQPSKANVAKCPSELVDSKTYECLLKNAAVLENHIAPLNGKHLKGASGRILKENNGSKATGILNGHLCMSSSKNSNGLIQAKHNSKVQKEVLIKDQTLGEQKQPSAACKKRKIANEDQVASGKKIKGSSPLDQKSTVCNEKLNLLRSKVIKVDKSFSDEEVRRRAQNILQVNLSPIIRIHPVSLTST